MRVAVDDDQVAAAAAAGAPAIVAGVAVDDAVGVVAAALPQ